MQLTLFVVLTRVLQSLLKLPRKSFNVVSNNFDIFNHLFVDVSWLSHFFNFLLEIGTKNLLIQYKLWLFYFITLLAAPVGKMKRVLCSDWLPERARWAHRACSGLPALIPRMKKIELQTAFGILGQRRRWKRKKRETIVKTKKTETTLVGYCATNTVGFLSRLSN